jgi:hypothetical protein
MAMAMEIVVSAGASGPEIQPHRVMRIDDDIRRPSYSRDD